MTEIIMNINFEILKKMYLIYRTVSEGTPIHEEQVLVEGSQTTITAPIAVVVVIASLVVVALALWKSGLKEYLN